MENFPTPKLAMVPRIANLLTLAFLVGTTWWSSAQRPLVHETAAQLSAPMATQARQVTQVTQVNNKPSQLQVDNSAPASRSSIGPANSSEGLISVGFTGASLR